LHPASRTIGSRPRFHACLFCRCALPVFLWMPSPASLTQNGLILPQTSRRFRVLLLLTRPTSPDVKHLPWGLHSLFAVSAGRIHVQRLPHRQTFPSMTFLTSTTVSASSSLVGLFHPTTTSRVLATGVYLLTHSRADSSSSRALSSVSQSSLLAVAHKRHVP
jgi:hypothetical protein